jgi:hypothetical protein
MERPSGKLRRLTFALFESSGVQWNFNQQCSGFFVLVFMLFMLKHPCLGPFFGSFGSTGPGVTFSA